MRNPKPFLTADNITIRLRDKLILQGSFWQIKNDEHWAILGPNGSGKSTFVRSLWGGAPLRGGRITYDFSKKEPPPHLTPPKEAIGYVSFEMHQRLVEQEELQEELRDYAGKKEEVTSGQDVIFSGILANRPVTAEDQERLLATAERLQIGHLLPRSILSLSTGEMRKILIARALIKSPQLLILDEPFDGLDEAARESLAVAINRLMSGPLRVILVAHRLEEIVPNITHVLFVKNGQLSVQGPKEKVLNSENLSSLYGCNLRLGKNNGRYSLSFGLEKNEKIDGAALPGQVFEDLPEVLIQMKDTTVRYGDVIALNRLNWLMKRGENWAILGPNGSGKSTILKLILGDHLQGYSNQITLFGKRRGSGETLWEIKKNIGAVSSELQVQYRKKMSAGDVVASGFYDSIGLYQSPTAAQTRMVDQWVEFLNVGDIAREPYPELSYGQKRMILLARAMVKSPALLVVDEPCHGLDIPNRRRVLKILEKIGKTKAHLLYVTNHQEEILNCITHIMRLQQGKVLGQGRKEEVLG